METDTFKSDEELDKVRSEFFTHQFLTGYKTYGGCTLPEYFEKFRNEIENLEVYDDDVWVTSFPKTGSTWTREIVWCIANDFNFDPEKLLPQRFPLLEYCVIYDLRKHVEDNPDFQPLELITDSINLVKNAARPRFIKTHLPWNLLPRQIRHLEKHPKIIHIARNPKDTCVHYFHHSKLNIGYTGSFEDFWQLFISNKLIYTPYWGNVLSYWNKRDQPNLLYLTYEEMKIDLPKVINKIAEFFDKKIDDDLMEQLKKHLSYENIRTIRPKQTEPVTTFLKQLNLCQNESGHFMRAGLIGNYRAQMCADVIDIFNKWTDDFIKDTGLYFDMSRDREKKVSVIVE